MPKRSRKDQRARRHHRLRKKVQGTAQRPRMAVFTSEKHLYVQFIDDEAGRTIAAVSTLDKEVRADNVKGNVDGAKVIGKVAAERAKKIGVEAVVFDRGGFKYHGRVKAIADAAREAGIKF